jgi:large subunit ribosomal protein L15
VSLKANELAPPGGARRPARRAGRGNASGQGTYAGRGLKGQRSRSGKKTAYDAFEGGQFPVSRKFHTLRGFNNKWRTSYQPVNVAALEKFADGSTVTPELLKEAGVVRHLREPLKLLARGEISRRLNVTVHAASAAARAKVEAAGGRVTLVGGEAALESGAV